MWRQIMFLKRYPTIERGVFIDKWMSLLQQIAARPISQRPIRLVANLPLDPPHPELTRMFGDRYDGVAEFWFDSLDSAEAILLDLEQDNDLQRASAALIDVEASSRWIAEVVPFLDKDETGVFFIMAGQQADGWTIDEAQHYWREKHFALAQTVEDYIVYLTRYVQMHGRHLAPLEDTQLLGRYDFHPMSAQVGLRHPDDIATAFSLPSYLKTIRPDELKFAKQGEMLSFLSTQRVEFG